MSNVTRDPERRISPRAPRRRWAVCFFACGGALSVIVAGCSTPSSVVSVATDAARACDVLLDVDPAKAPDVTFGSGVRGASSLHGSRLGISWIASNDVPFGAHAVVVSGPRTSKILTSTCYDLSGRPIANPNVTLQ